MPDAPFGRRRLLVGAGLLAAAAATGVAVVPRLLDDETDDGDGGGANVPAGSPTEAIALVGAAYLAGAPEDEADAEHLRTLLPSLTAPSATGIVDQLPSLRDSVRADFGADRVADVDGWILSLTEARAAALVHLVA
jgi:hypothetical protein